MLVRPGSNTLEFAKITSDFELLWEMLQEEHNGKNGKIPEPRAGQIGFLLTAADDLLHDSPLLSDAEKVKIMRGLGLLFKHRIKTIEYGKSWVTSPEGNMASKGSTMYKNLDEVIYNHDLTDLGRRDVLQAAKKYLENTNILRKLQARAAQRAKEANELEARRAKEANEEDFQELVEAIDRSLSAEQKPAVVAKKVTVDTSNRIVLSEGEKAQLVHEEIMAIENLSCNELVKEISDILTAPELDSSLRPNKDAQYSVLDEVRRFNQKVLKHVTPNAAKTYSDKLDVEYKEEDVVRLILRNAINQLNPSYQNQKLYREAVVEPWDYNVKDRQVNVNWVKTSVEGQKATWAKDESDQKLEERMIRDQDPSTMQMRKDRLALEAAKAKEVYLALVQKGLKLLTDQDKENIKKIADAQGRDLELLKEKGLRALVKQGETYFTLEEINALERKAAGNYYYHPNSQVETRVELDNFEPVRFEMPYPAKTASRWVAQSPKAIEVGKDLDGKKMETVHHQQLTSTKIFAHVMAENAARLAAKKLADERYALAKRKGVTPDKLPATKPVPVNTPKPEAVEWVKVKAAAPVVNKAPSFEDAEENQALEAAFEEHQKAMNATYVKPLGPDTQNAKAKTNKAVDTRSVFDQIKARNNYLFGRPAALKPTKTTVTKLDIDNTNEVAGIVDRSIDPKSRPTFSRK